MPLCIPKSQVEKVKRALRSGDFTLANLYKMDSAEMNKLFASYVGESLAPRVSAVFEEAIISSNKKAFANVIKRTFTPTQRADLLGKVEKIDKLLTEKDIVDFKENFVSRKLGIEVSKEEIKTLIDLKNVINTTKAKIIKTSPIRSQERLEYGLALETFKNYSGELKLQAGKLTALDYLKNPSELFYQITGISKSSLSSFDDSFFGRQGYASMLDPRKTGIWLKNFAKSWKDITIQLLVKPPKIDINTWKSFVKSVFAPQKDPVMQMIKADIFSRPNAINGKYSAAKNEYGLGVSSEEAYPTSLPERIPILGRLFKASEVAFNGGALRMRADLADSWIANAEKRGVNMLDTEEATAAGKVISVISGRGDIGGLEQYGKKINAVLFSIKWLKSQWDFLTVHSFGKGLETTYAKKEAAKNLASVIATMSTIMGIAKLLNPNNANFDPRSGRIGYIGDTNIGGGMGAMLQLASSVIPTMHNGEWGFWRQNRSTGKWVKLNSGQFGANTAKDMVMDFFTGKTAPLVSTYLQFLDGRDYSGKKPTIKGAGLKLITPIPVQTFQRLKDNSFAEQLRKMLAEEIGFSVYIPFKKTK